MMAQIIPAQSLQIAHGKCFTQFDSSCETPMSPLNYRIVGKQGVTSADPIRSRNLFIQ
jgi:hypothetical protein